MKGARKVSALGEGEGGAERGVNESDQCRDRPTETVETSM